MVKVCELEKLILFSLLPFVCCVFYPFVIFLMFHFSSFLLLWLPSVFFPPLVTWHPQTEDWFTSMWTAQPLSSVLGIWLWAFSLLISIFSRDFCCCLVAKSWLTLCDPMDMGSLPCSSVHGIFQARILEWVANSFSKWCSPPRDRTCISCIGRQILYHWATGEDLRNTYRHL